MTVCPECNGSGIRMGFNREIECFDCGGEGQWEDKPELCFLCATPLNDGECPVCDAHLASATERDLRFTMELQKRRVA